MYANRPFKTGPETKNPQKLNGYKVLYKFAREKRRQEMLKQKSEQEIINYHISNLEEEDSLDDLSGAGKESQLMAELKSPNHKNQHNRSHSCPMVSPKTVQNQSHCGNKNHGSEVPHKNIEKKVGPCQVEHENRRTLKKTSAKPLKRKNQSHQHQKHTVSHGNPQLQHVQSSSNLADNYSKHLYLTNKYSTVQESQFSNTVVVHCLPIEQLSSMLYSGHQQTENRLQKKNALQTPVNSVKMQKKKVNHLKAKGSKKRQKIVDSKDAKCSPLIFEEREHGPPRIHSELFLKTMVEQQIKFYDLNKSMLRLQKEKRNAKIRQTALAMLMRSEKSGGRPAEEEEEGSYPSSSEHDSLFTS